MTVCEGKEVTAHQQVQNLRRTSLVGYSRWEALTAPGQCYAGRLHSRMLLQNVSCRQVRPTPYTSCCWKNYLNCIDIRNLCFYRGLSCFCLSVCLSACLSLGRRWNSKKRREVDQTIWGCNFEVRHPRCVSNKSNYKVYAYIVRHNYVLDGMLFTICKAQPHVSAINVGYLQVVQWKLIDQIYMHL